MRPCTRHVGISCWMCLLRSSIPWMPSNGFFKVGQCSRPGAHNNIMVEAQTRYIQDTVFFQESSCRNFVRTS